MLWLIAYFFIQPTHAYDLPSEYLGSYQIHVDKTREYGAASSLCNDETQISIAQSDNIIAVKGLQTEKPVYFSDINSGPATFVDPMAGMTQKETYTYHHNHGFGIAVRTRQCHSIGLLLGEVACTDQKWQQDNWIFFGTDTTSNEVLLMVSFKPKKDSKRQFCILKKSPAPVTPK